MGHGHSAEQSNSSQNHGRTEKPSSTTILSGHLHNNVAWNLNTSCYGEIQVGIPAQVRGVQRKSIIHKAIDKPVSI